MLYSFRIGLVVLGAVLFSNGCHAQPPPQVECTVGTIPITSQELAYQRRVDSVNYGRAQTREHAATELMVDALEREVLESAFHVTPPIEALREKAAWIDSNTKDPVKLKAKKKIFGSDTCAYYTLIVSPTLVNPRLHAMFTADTNLQRAVRDSIEKIWAVIVKDPSQFYRFPLDTLKIAKHTGPNKLLAALRVSQPEQVPDPLIAAVLSHLKVGTLWGHIIEDDQSYKILALISENDSEYRSLAIVVQKAPFGLWYQAYVHEHIPIAFSDTALESDIRKADPTLWWLPE